MKRLTVFVFALLLGASLSFAQGTTGSSGKPTTTSDDQGKGKDKGKEKSGKKGHKGGKKSKKSSGGTTTPPPK